MNLVIAEAERVQAQYVGHFAEPIFAVLGNPAKLYTHLLRYLAPFGATAASLSIDVSVLAEAHVKCVLPSGHVRVSLDRLEVFLRDLQSRKQFAQMLQAVFSSVSETDDSLRPVRHEGVLQAWARLSGEPFSAYIRRFVGPPESFAGWNPTLELRKLEDDGSTAAVVRLEEAAMIPDGLFVRAGFGLGSGFPPAEQLVAAFIDKVDDRFQELGLQLPLRIE